MATDGPKIIDGDLANDTYWGIMDLYDGGATERAIKMEFPLTFIDDHDEFYQEIYSTSCGLAYWELGWMNADYLAHIQTVIAKEAGIKEWGYYDEKEGKKRKSVLKRFITKISKPNTKIRHRKKYRKVKHFVFEANTVIGTKGNDGKYRTWLCTEIEQYRGHCTYNLTPLLMTTTQKPSRADLEKAKVLMNKIGSGYGRVETMAMQSGVQKIWKLVEAESEYFFVGLICTGIDHKYLLQCKKKFEILGKIVLSDPMKYTGSNGYVSTYEKLLARIVSQEEWALTNKYLKIPIQLLKQSSEPI